MEHRNGGRPGDLDTTGYKRAEGEAHAPMSPAFKHVGDIDPTEPAYLIITLDPLPRTVRTEAFAEICQHLS